jgi:precorrin-6A synthase
MPTLTLVGIGTGNPDHLTGQAVRALNAADLILLPRKGAGKEDLADLRRAILAQVLTAPVTVAEFDLPVRDETIPDYPERVERWHDAIAAVWAATLAAHPQARQAALLVWGDPSLYDSTLRIAARLPGLEVRVVPGLTSLQLLTAAHAIPLNPLAGPVTITTGRRLREEGFPRGVEAAAVMLDGGCAFAALDPQGITIWWGAYLGMAEEILVAGPLAEAGPQIVQRRAEARARHGWIMDIYLLRREGGGP